MKHNTRPSNSQQKHTPQEHRKHQRNDTTKTTVTAAQKNKPRRRHEPPPPPPPLSHLDASRGSGAQPVAVGRENEGVDDVSGIERVQALAFLEVPQHGGAVLASGGAQRTVRRHGHRVQVSGPIKSPLTQRGKTDIFHVEKQGFTEQVPEAANNAHKDVVVRIRHISCCANESKNCPHDHHRKRQAANLREPCMDRRKR